MATCDAQSIQLLQDALDAANAEAQQAEADYNTATQAAANARAKSESAADCANTLRQIDRTKYANAIRLLDGKAAEYNTTATTEQAKADEAKTRWDNAKANAAILADAIAALTPDATTGQAGTPGKWLPEGNDIPADAAQANAWQVTADPGSAWTVGQYIKAVNEDVYWDGTKWKTGRAPAPAATGATAGTPGSFTPNGSTAPANLAAMADITASPTTAWTVGQYVVLGDSSKAYWDGTAWKAGEAPAPAATGATAGTPGSFTPNGSATPANLAALADVTASPATAWTEGQYVTLGDDSDAYWDGSAWKAGKAPAPGVTATARTARR